MDLRSKRSRNYKYENVIKQNVFDWNLGQREKCKVIETVWSDKRKKENVQREWNRCGHEEK